MHTRSKEGTFRGLGTGCDIPTKGKKGYVDFKRVVWHEAFKKLLETLPDHSQVGCWTECGDKITWQLFPGVIILSSDYEEQ